MAKILFIQNFKAEFPGIMYLSAVLKKHGHSCEVEINNDLPALLQALRQNPPDVIGFSLMSGMQHWALQVSREIKKNYPGIFIVFGGVHPTYFPEIIEEAGVDIVCRGEGEYAMLDLMDAVEKAAEFTTILNLWVKQGGVIYKNELRPLIANLDELPFMDHELYYAKYPSLQNKSVKVFFGMRGCPYDCSFCFNHKLKEMYRGKGKYVRSRSKENIIAEILEVKAKYVCRQVYFISDVMFIDKKWALDFLTDYRMRVGLSFMGLIRADILDEELVKNLKESGCRAVAFGIEAGNESYRNQLLKKKLSNEQILHTGALLKKYGIKFRAYCMMCLPGETIAQAYDTIEINIKIKTDFPWCSVYNPYSGTELVDYAKEIGALAPDFNINSLDDSYYKGSVIKNDKVNELLNLQRFFQTAVLFPRTFPLIKRLAKLPPNFLFDLWFQFIFFIVYVRSEGHGLWETVQFGLDYVKVFYRKKQ
jgi:anaerobic magnesium-protoporphyrin IX monomethyl ester cyclase